MTRRILTIISAIVLALIGTFAVLLYVKSADQRNLDGQKAVTVLVATQQIPAGTTASAAMQDGLLASERLPAASVSGTDYVSRITSQLGPLVASANIPSGQLLLRPMLVASVASSTGLAIPAGDVAVTIALCVPQAVAGYVAPGSEVAVFDTVGGGSGGCSTGSSSLSASSSQSGAKAKISTRIVLSKVTVIAVGQAVPPSNISGATNAAFAQSTSSSSVSSGTVLVTFAVSQADAARVITLAQDGLPYLALLSRSG